MNACRRSIIRNCLYALIVGSGYQAPAALSQAFPSRPLNIIVPYTSGTGSDILARLIQAPLSERLKQPVVIHNKPGAGAILGIKSLKDAEPDGYTIGIIASANVIVPWINKDVPFDIRKDFLPITSGYSGPLVMVVPSGFPAANVVEFVSHARRNPSFFGSAGEGTTSHLVAEMLNQASGLTMTHVPFKGSPEVYTAMFGGNVQVFFDNYATPKAMVEAGKLRALAVTSAQRVPWLPNVPTVAESYPGFEATFWVGFAAPRGVPQDVYDRLVTDVRAVMLLPQIRAKLADMGLVAGGMAAPEFGRMLYSEYDKWGKVVQGAGLKPQ